jgi:hypothetical protein
MTDPVTLQSIKETAAALNNCGLSSLEDLRLWISKDIDESIPLLAQSSGTTQSLLMALLIAESCDDAGRSGRPKLTTYWRGLKTFPGLLNCYSFDLAQTWHVKKFGVIRSLPAVAWPLFRQILTRHTRLWYNWRRHWADAILIVVVPVLLISLSLRVESARSSRIQSVAVKSSAQLRPFQRISDEVEMASMPPSNIGFRSIDQVRGRYALVALPGGAPVLSNQILNAELSDKIANRAIVSIPLKAGIYPSELSPPFDAVLILSPRKTGSRGTTNSLGKHQFDVLLLGIDKPGQSPTATVAITNEDLDKVAALLGSHDAYISRVIR